MRRVATLRSWSGSGPLLLTVRPTDRRREVPSSNRIACTASPAGWSGSRCTRSYLFFFLDFVFAFTPGARSRGVGENREGGVGKSEIRNPKSEISYATFASAFLSAFVSVLGVLFLAPSESLAAGAGLSFSLGREPLPLP